uniref:Uncharacterized protein n=1 Tax=Arundo donax TaxID=35708 RepID=A0A0A9D941_ARUDO
MSLKSWKSKAKGQNQSPKIEFWTRKAHLMMPKDTLGPKTPASLSLSL